MKSFRMGLRHRDSSFKEEVIINVSDGTSQEEAAQSEATTLAINDFADAVGAFYKVEPDLVDVAIDYFEEVIVDNN